MAQLTYQTINAITGLNNPTLAAAAGGGDVIACNDRGCFVVKNGGGSSITVTLAVPGNTRYGIANPDPTYTVVAGATAYIGPLPTDLADPTDGQVHFTYSGVTSVTVGGFSI